MADVEKTLPVTHINIRQSISILLFRFVVLELIAAFGVIVFHASVFSAATFAQIMLYFTWTNAIIFFLLVILKTTITILIVLWWLNEYYEVTPTHVTHVRGVVYRKTDKYPFTHFRAIKIQQGLLGKLFNYGTLEVYDWDMKKDISLYLIHNPYKYLRLLENLLPGADEEKNTIREHIFEQEE